MKRVRKILSFVIFLMLMMSHADAFALPVTITPSTEASGVSVYYWYGDYRIGGPSQTNEPGWPVPPLTYLEFVFQHPVQQVTATVVEVSMPWIVGFPTDFFVTDHAGNILATAQLPALMGVGDSADITLFSDLGNISSLFVEHWPDMDDAVMITSLTYVTIPEPATVKLLAVGGVATLLLASFFLKQRKTVA